MSLLISLRHTEGISLRHTEGISLRHPEWISLNRKCNVSRIELY